MNLIDDMINKIDEVQDHMKRQSGSLSEILAKSDHVLVQMEANCLQPLSESPTAGVEKKPFSYQKDTFLALSRIVELADQLKQREDSRQTETSFIEYLETAKPHIQFLCSNVRKLYTISDIVTRMKDELWQIAEEEPEDDCEDFFKKYMADSDEEGSEDS